MFLEDRIRKLCEEIIASGDEAQAVVLAQELQIALREYIEQLRGKLIVLPSLAEKVKPVKQA